MFVVVPMDVVMRYHRRLASRAHCLQELGVNALEWVQPRDEAERNLWVKEYRNSELTLGKVISQIFERRESVWIVDEEHIRERQRQQRETK